MTRSFKGVLFYRRDMLPSLCAFVCYLYLGVGVRVSGFSLFIGNMGESSQTFKWRNSEC